MSDLLTSLSAAGVTPLLVAVVFAASMMQAVTGIGFGVIAGPVLLVSMGSSGAIQVSIVLSFLIAALLSPATIRKVRWSLLRPLLSGVLLGTPLGAVVYVSSSIEVLKIIAAVVVACMTVIASGLLARFPVFEKDSHVRRIGVGIVCGVLNTTLAMPGPPVAAYATAIKSDKQTIRATTLVTFLFAYPVALILQGAWSGLSSMLYTLAAPLAVPTVLGTITGMLIASMFSERLFKWLTVAFLAASALALVFG